PRTVREIRAGGARNAGRRGARPGETAVGRERRLPRVNLEDLLAPFLVGQVHDEAAVETPGPEQRAVEDVRLVRRREHDDAFAAREAVHLGQELLQRLLVLGRRAPERDAAAGSADRVDLVDKDDRGRMLARLPDQIAHARRTDADDHLDELRGAHREERHARLAGDRAREQRLAGARRPDEQHAFRRRAAQARVLLRILEEIDDLDELVLDLVDAGDVLERHALVALRVVAACAALPDTHEAADPAALARRPAEEPHVERDDQYRRPEPEQKQPERRRARGDRLRRDLDAVL